MMEAIKGGVSLNKKVAVKRLPTEVNKPVIAMPQLRPVRKFQTKYEIESDNKSPLIQTTLRPLNKR